MVLGIGENLERGENKSEFEQNHCIYVLSYHTIKRDYKMMQSKTILNLIYYFIVFKFCNSRYRHM